MVLSDMREKRSRSRAAHGLRLRLRPDQRRVAHHPDSASCVGDASASDRASDQVDCLRRRPAITAAPPASNANAALAALGSSSGTLEPPLLPPLLLPPV